jgi:predicted TIM-barrel fold metal-dependent hydrolase
VARTPARVKTQFNIQCQVTSVLKSYPDLIIFGHLVGFQCDPKRAVDLHLMSDNVVADTTFDPEGSTVDLPSLMESVGSTKFVFGSDYPIHGRKFLIKKTIIFKRLRIYLHQELDAFFQYQSRKHRIYYTNL